ncbi:UNVERIFIED_ORG: hypothetical protein M2193_004599 [Bradyrhizobium japonicum]
MADRRPARGRKPLEGVKEQFLIRRIKAAAAPRDKTASMLLEEISREWFDRHQDEKKA